MKKLLTILIAAALICGSTAALAGCGSSEEKRTEETTVAATTKAPATTAQPTTAEPTTAEPATAEPTTAAPETEAETEAPAPETKAPAAEKVEEAPAQNNGNEQNQAQQDAPSGSFEASDAVFTYNGASVELNQNMSSVLSALGNANNVSSQLSCHGIGDDKTYEYNGFVVNTYPKDGKDYVLEIVVSSASIATSKGVKVGDSVSSVTAAYGNGYSEIGMYYAYDAGNGKSLQFFIEDGKVAEIDYYYEV